MCLAEGRLPSEALSAALPVVLTDPASADKTAVCLGRRRGNPRCRIPTVAVSARAAAAVVLVTDAVDTAVFAAVGNVAAHGLPHGAVGVSQRLFGRHAPRLRVDVVAVHVPLHVYVRGGRGAGVDLRAELQRHEVEAFYGAGRRAAAGSAPRPQNLLSPIREVREVHGRDAAELLSRLKLDKRSVQLIQNHVKRRMPNPPVHQDGRPSCAYLCRTSRRSTTSDAAPT